MSEYDAERLDRIRRECEADRARWDAMRLGPPVAEPQPWTFVSERGGHRTVGRDDGTGLFWTEIE